MGRRSLAAIVKGFAQFEPGVRVAGVIANQGGSQRHRAWLAEALTNSGTAPLVGLVPRGALPALPRRHLGLVAANQADLTPTAFDELADACVKHLDLDLLLTLAQNGARWGRLPAGQCPAGWKPAPPDAPGPDRKIRLGLARDEAFHFYYPDNLEALAHRGVQWVPFSPLNDRQLPAALDGLYLGGGYPEVHAARLSDNVPLLEEIRQFAASGRVLYAECGGLMYLGRAITLLDGTCHPLAGILPVETAMLDRFAELGYAEMTWTADGLWGRTGQKIRGHEFHYSRILGADAPGDGWRSAGLVGRRRVPPTPAGYCRERILAGYVHLHWASRPEAMDQFLSCCEARP